MKPAHLPTFILHTPSMLNAGRRGKIFWSSASSPSQPPGLRGRTDSFSGPLLGKLLRSHPGHPKLGVLSCPSWPWLFQLWLLGFLRLGLGLCFRLLLKVCRSTLLPATSPGRILSLASIFWVILLHLWPPIRNRVQVARNQSRVSAQLHGGFVHSVLTLLSVASNLSEFLSDTGHISTMRIAMDCLRLTSRVDGLGLFAPTANHVHPIPLSGNNCDHNVPGPWV